MLFNPIVFTLHANLLCFVPVWTIYAISYLFTFCFTPPPTLAAPSDSRRSCKMKATALLHVTIPTVPFLFHWPQTPDFSEAKNRPLQTLTPPPLFPLNPLPFFLLLVYRLSMGSLSVLCPFFTSMCQIKPRVCIHSCVSLWERDVRILYAVRLIESVWFLYTLIRESQSDKDWFHRAVNLTSAPIEMLAKVTGP